MTLWIFAPSVLSDWARGLLLPAGLFWFVVLIDFASGALAAWQQNTFDLEKAPQFFKTGAGFFGAWLLTELLALVPLLFGNQIPGWGEALADYGPNVILGGIVLTKYLSSISKHIDALRNMDNPEPVSE